MIRVHWSSNAETARTLEAAYEAHDFTDWALVRQPDGLWQAWRGGEEVFYECDIDRAVSVLVPHYNYPGGHVALYYPIGTDGDIAGGPVCADCARAAVKAVVDYTSCHAGHHDPDNQTAFHVETGDGDLHYLQSIVCDWCSAVMEEQACPECGDSVHGDAKVYHHDHGFAIHRSCLASLVASQRAEKTGKREYLVHKTGLWASGTYRS